MKLWPFKRKLWAAPPSAGGWMTVHESYPGAWQQSVKLDRDGVLRNPYVFRCQSMIARDIAKLRVKLVRQADGIWSETTNPAFSPVLRKPNSFQTRNQFWETYFLSKLAQGNVYVLKQRDARRVVTALYVLDPARVQPLVSDSGAVLYQLSTDNLAQLPESVTVPASEIIHDRWNCLFHPLVGISPVWANALAATQSQRIAENAAGFFANQARPGGILTAPGKITDETAKRLKEAFESGYSGQNAGRIAVVGDGLTFTPLTVTATDSQLVEQLKWTAETVAATYGVPLYKLGLGNMPTANNLQALNVEYYSQALQGLIEDAETCLDDGLGLDGLTMGTEFDVDGLLRMDSQTQMEVLDKAKSVLTLDERRRRLDLPKITGGDTVYMQEQDHSIEAIAARDKLLIEQASAPTPSADPAPPAPPADETERALLMLEVKMMRAVHAGH